VGWTDVAAAVVQKITTVPQRTPSLHGDITGDLLHPKLIRVNRDSSNVHPAALKMDEKQHVVGHQTAQREHLCGEEVGHSETAGGENKNGGFVGMSSSPLVGMTDRSSSNPLKLLERVKGIEPSSSAWKGAAISMIPSASDKIGPFPRV
jgi:hypothetical protein